MQQRMKQRLVGAVVLVALAVIFIPMLLTGPVERQMTDVPVEIPPPPVVSAPDELEQAAPVDTAPLTASTPIEMPRATAVPAPENPTPPLIAPDEPAERGPNRTPAELAAWTVQVGSFGDEANAMALRDRLRKKRYSAYVDALTANGKSFYRVRVGPMIQRTEAETAQARLAKEERIKGLVMPHP
jgi:DedD protein